MAQPKSENPTPRRPAQYLDAVRTSATLQQRLAMYLVLHCVRNSRLEDLHAGIAPWSATGDYTDVTVTSPFGAIPWRGLSRFSDEEMKALMIDVVDRTYRFIQILFTEHSGRALLAWLADHDPTPAWDAPHEPCDG
jgi:ligand-binding SRPBCC domain-containing protein